MHTILSLLASFILLITPIIATPLPASPAPATTILRRLSEKNPWHINSLSIFTAAPSSPSASYISFTFTDSNAGLDLTTSCVRTVLPDSGESLVDGTNWYACANSTVGFLWGGFGKGLQVQRSYIDLAVGQPPWDIVTAFGTSPVISNATAKTTACGTLGKVGSLKVSVTQEIA